MQQFLITGPLVNTLLKNTLDYILLNIPFILQQKFFSTVGMDRNESNTLIFIIKEGEEPGSFTSNFQKWSDDREK